MPNKMKNQKLLKCPNCGSKEYTSVTMAIFRSSGNSILSRDPIDICICEECYIMFIDSTKFIKSIKDGN